MKKNDFDKVLKRCEWVPEENPLQIKYHDEEWGVPVHDDRIHFEFLLLEGAQAGLSWDTILKRRKEYAKAFSNFHWEKVAKYDENKIEDLLANSGIIRNRLKVEAAVNNAKQFIKIRKEFGSFDAYVWRFVDGKPKHHRHDCHTNIPCESEESHNLSKDLKKRGFKFVGPTIMYAYMQAVGLVNDHLKTCFRYHL
jgi:DNA-3-methyladenine glycosylase I